MDLGTSIPYRCRAQGARKYAPIVAAMPSALPRIKRLRCEARRAADWEVNT